MLKALMQRFSPKPEPTPRRRRTPTPWKGNEPAGDRFRGDIAKNYLADRVDKELWTRENQAVKALLTRVRDKSSVLDVPFGTGRFVDLYRAKNMRIAGLDASEDMIEEARRVLGRKMSGIDVRVGDARNLPWPDKAHDVAVCIRFCESIIAAKDVPAFLRDLRRVTRQHLIMNFHCRVEGEPAVEIDPEGRIGSNMTMAQGADFLRSAGWNVVENIRTLTEKDGKGEKRMWLLS